MGHITSLLFAFFLVAAVLAEDPKPEGEDAKSLVKKHVADDLGTASSYGLGYGLSYPYHGYGGLGSLSHGLGAYSGGYGGGYGKAFVLPVYNYGYGGLGSGGLGYGGLGYGGYTKGYGSYPYGYNNIGFGGHSPYGTSYYSYPYGSSYYSGHHGLGGHYGAYY